MQDQGRVHVPDWLQDQNDEQAALDMQSSATTQRRGDAIFRMIHNGRCRRL